MGCATSRWVSYDAKLNRRYKRHSKYLYLALSRYSTHHATAARSKASDLNGRRSNALPMCLDMPNSPQWITTMRNPYAYLKINRQTQPIVHVANNKVHERECIYRKTTSVPSAKTLLSPYNNSEKKKTSHTINYSTTSITLPFQ